jgi:hypothetical protein
VLGSLMAAPALRAAACKVNEVGIVMAASPRQQFSAVGFLYTTLLCFF